MQRIRHVGLCAADVEQITSELYSLQQPLNAEVDAAFSCDVCNRPSLQPSSNTQLAVAHTTLLDNVVNLLTSENGVLKR